jgi:hypothetical protein
LILAVAVIVVVLFLIRTRRLQERHALIWLAGAVVIVILGISSGALAGLASALGIAYPPSALFLVVVAFLAFALLEATIALSRLTLRVRTLAQRLAMLDEEVRRLRAAVVPDAADDRGESARIPAGVALDQPPGDGRDAATD